MPANILIVEDDETIRNMFARALRGRGIEVDELTAADDAVAAIRSGAYGIVLIAPNALASDRHAVLNAVRNDHHRPVILLLSDTTDDVQRVAGDVAVMMCIDKRFAIRNLEPVVAAIVAVSRIH